MQSMDVWRERVASIRMASPTPPTENREFKDDIIRLADLTATTHIIDGLRFSNCHIMGPAVIVFRDSKIAHCRWNAPGVDAMFWEIPPDRTQVVGAVLCSNCEFVSCSFEQIGIAGTPATRDEMLLGFSSP